jgi:signal transduction histidine kinase/DNA-binding NarL/FixJ family response regulator
MANKFDLVLKKFLYDIKIGSRLVLGFSVILTVFILATTITMWSLAVTISKINRIENNSLPDVLLASEMSQNLVSFEKNLYKTAIMLSDTGLSKAFEEIEKLKKNIQKFKLSYEKKGDSAAINAINRLEIDYTTLQLYGFAGADAYLGEGPKIGRERFKDFDVKAIPIEKRVDSFKNGRIKEVKTVTAGIVKSVYRVEQVLVFFSLLAIFLSTRIAISVSRSITRPTAELVEVATAISNGNLDIYTTINRKDEIGQLATTFSVMKHTLNEMLKELEMLIGSVQKGRLDARADANEFKGVWRNLITDFNKVIDAYYNLNSGLENLVKERTSQLEVAKDAAETANRAKSVFLANMSHELRTPLNAILGFARLTKEGTDVTSEQRKNLDIITLSGGHLLNLINNVLDISKIESGRMSLEITPVDIYQMIQEMSSLLYVNAEERGLSFIVEQVPQLPRRIDVDGGKLRQTLINLIGNAIKYTKRGGIVLRAKVAEKRAEQMRLRFEVEDTGPGISEEDRKKLFKPFMQLNGQSAAVTGTGLGLSISRQFVELMGGQIDVISEKGKGSLFFFEIPVKELPLEELEVVHEHGRAIGLEEGQPRYRLLIAEDQLENRLLLHKILQSFEFDIREAANGREAVEIFEQWHPDLIWMDMRMPIMDGLDATHRIRATEAGEHTKIIALTAQAFEEDRVKIMQAGCDDFIRKPYRDIELFDALTRHLGLRFIYEKKAAAPSSGPEMKLKPEQLGALPQDLVNKLHQAVEGLDPERINDVINKITQHDPPIGGALQKLANRLDYDHLLQLLDEYVKIITGKHC